MLGTAELRRHEVVASLQVQQLVVLLQLVVFLSVLVDQSVYEVELLLELAHSE